MHTLIGHNAPVGSVAFSPDGKTPEQARTAGSFSGIYRGFSI
ncbi:hypothetical protein [Scytonema sp. NUACC26]